MGAKRHHITWHIPITQERTEIAAGEFYIIELIDKKRLRQVN
jgi:hypothetical protein